MSIQFKQGQLRTAGRTGLGALLAAALAFIFFCFALSATNPGFCADEVTAPGDSNDGTAAKAQEDKTDQQPGPAAVEDLDDLFSYQPPKRGRPSNRIGGGVRALTKSGTIVALVPQGHVGVTVDPSPSFYWFISGFNETTRVVMTLNDLKSPDPICTQTFEIPSGGGIQSISLAKSGISLAEGNEYEWIVEAFDEKDRYTPTKASGGRIIFDKEASPPQVSGASPSEKARIFGSSGLWYDCLSAIDAAISESKSPEKLRSQRIKLMKDAGLIDEIVKSGFEGQAIDGVSIR